MKAILVIDMPNNCSECPCCNERECGNEYKGYVDDYIGWNSGRPSWCQLRPMPLRKLLLVPNNEEQNVKLNRIWNDGWNACIDEITGETE